MAEVLYHCPHCDAECTVSQVGGTKAEKPSPGEFCRCVGCHSLLVATTDDFRLGTRRDVERMPAELLVQLHEEFGEMIFAEGA